MGQIICKCCICGKTTSVKFDSIETEEIRISHGYCEPCFQAELEKIEEEEEVAS